MAKAKKNGRLTSHGYIRVRAPGHPVTQGDGGAYEHRVVLYDAIGPGEHPCRWCGTPVTWGVELQADHVDGNRANNIRENLVQSCPGCNTRRNTRWAKRQTHCRRANHKLTPENTYIVPTTGARQCRTCGNARKAEHARRRRAGIVRPEAVPRPPRLCRVCGSDKAEAGTAGWYCEPCAQDPMRGARKVPEICDKGHRLDGDNLTYVRASKASNRLRWRCVLCTREKSYAAYLRRRDAGRNDQTEASLAGHGSHRVPLPRSSGDDPKVGMPRPVASIRNSENATVVPG